MFNRDKETDSLYEELGRRVGAARRRQNLTQEQLAAAVGLTRTSITNLEKGRQKALLHTVFGLADALRVDVSDLLPLSKAPTPLQKLDAKKQELILSAIPEMRDRSRV